MQAKKFKNFSNEDFTWKYDGVPFTFKVGEEMYLEDFKADHFAKHLVDREMNRAQEGYPHGIPTNLPVQRKEMTERCFPSDVEITPAQALNLNEEVKTKKKKVEPEFEDLHITPRKKL